MLDVVVEDREGEGVKGGADGGDLGEDVDAVAAVGDHLLDAAHLAGDAVHAFDERVLVGHVTVGGGVGAGRAGCAWPCGGVGACPGGGGWGGRLGHGPFPAGTEPAQPERIGNYEDAGKGHCPGGDDGLDDAGHSQRDGDQVVGERPPEVDLDGGQGAAGEPDGVGRRSQVPRDEG